MMKSILTIIGGFIGFVVAYALRPSHWGNRPSIGEMLTVPEFLGEVILYSIAGAIVGLTIGLVIDHFRKPLDKD